VRSASWARRSRLAISRTPSGWSSRSAPWLAPPGGVAPELENGTAGGIVVDPVADGGLTRSEVEILAHVVHHCSTCSGGGVAVSSTATWSEVHARAVEWHLDDRVLVHENRTIVY